MKKLLLLLPLITLCACSPKYSESLSVSDFTKYTKEGFFIYPIGTEIKNDYTPMANISMGFFVGVPSSKMKKVEGLNKHSYYDYLIPSGEYMTEKIVNAAKSYNSDAIINFQIFPEGNLKGFPAIYRATGTAVKIK